MIVIEDLKKKFEELPVLRGVNLTIEDGCTTAIIGGSGCGKSVLLKHIIGLLKPDSGSVFVDGDNIPQLPYPRLVEVRKKIGMVFQGSALFDSMTIEENMAMGLARHTKLASADIKKRISESLTMVGLAGVEPKFPAELSGGMKKRAAIARALVMKPQFLLYDEPTTGLDPPRADSINQVIFDLNEQLGVTSVVVTHDMHSVYRVAHKVAMLHEGRIHFYGTPAELAQCNEPAVLEFLESARGHEWLKRDN
ncbi:ATP-binding cassette domain-containing protein [candidate division KSB1 bacterium]|nr:ATP-binding cassette domain-containing protein [candidate division KSB1 bacterium]